MYLRNELISETAPTIFLKPGMKWGTISVKNSTTRFLKNSHFAQIWPNSILVLIRFFKVEFVVVETRNIFFLKNLFSKIFSPKISLKAEWCCFIVYMKRLLNQRKRPVLWFHLWMDISKELISETAITIFLKLGMKLGDNKGRKIARPGFDKNSHLGRFWPNVPKNAQNHSFWEFATKRL